MGFATSWLDKRALFPQIIKEAPDNQTGIIVVVPAYNEPGISALLDSLAQCIEPDCKVEILIVVNAKNDAGPETLRNNSECIKNIESWKENNKKCFFRLYVFDAGQPTFAGWGVGYARKTGMDEALRRFNAINKPDGVILSLDADCTVAKNYFTSICNDLLQRKVRKACSIYFEHPLSGNDFQENIYKYITFYELHMRYYLLGLRYSEFPYPFHTVGSAVAVKAYQYIKAGGMNRRQAGEDFYFIQKLVPLGGYFTLNSTTVYPSPRISTRVPFGTGSAIARSIDNKDQILLTYNIKAFSGLRLLFNMVEKLYDSRKSEITEFYKLLSPGLKSYINKEEWLLRITEINDNTAEMESFRKRFFGWFNMFRIIKYMNHVHNEIFEKQPVADAAYELLSITGNKTETKDPLDLLIFYRILEKNIVVK